VRRDTISTNFVHKYAETVDCSMLIVMTAIIFKETAVILTACNKCGIIVRTALRLLPPNAGLLKQ